MAAPGEDLLRRLAAHDESAARSVLELTPSSCGGAMRPESGLTPKVTMLVRLSALLAVDASTTSIRWAAEQAACAGVGVDELTAVLVTIARDVGTPRVVSCAPRLALAVGYDVELEGWDGT